MNKLKLSQNLLYVGLGYSLVSQLYFLSSFLINRTEYYNFGSWFILTNWVFPFLFVSAALLLTYLRFQKNNIKANWGLLIVLLYVFITTIMGIVALFLSWEYQVFNPISIITMCLFYLSSFVIIYGGYLAVFESEDVKKLNQKRKDYQPSEELSEKEFLPTLILCFFFGVIGIHRFYAGKIGTGLLMIFTLGGLGIWAIIDFIMICVDSFRDIDGRIIKYQRAVYVTSNSSSSEMSIATEIEKFSELKDKGIISEEEFNKKKEELLK